MYRVVYTKTARKHIPLLEAVGLGEKARKMVALVEKDPYVSQPPYEKLTGDKTGAYSRRINLKHRLVYQVLEDEKIVKILSMWSHYESMRVHDREAIYGK